ncbi:MAG: GAF domain-containing protein [Sphingomonadales bacterium]|nr:GAF domain-containing protein [Sphingomonadales bacterium]
MEPIHVIGRIQSFGTLLSFSPDWIVNHAAQNCAPVFGRGARDLLGHSAASVLAADALHEIRSRAQMLGSPDAVERLFGLDLTGDGRRFDVALHHSGRSWVIECEPAGSGRQRDHVSLVRPMVERMRSAGSVQALCDLAARMMRGLTGFDRVKVYRFEPDGGGEVVAESAAGGIDSFRGLHFPASDIPAQARALYARNLLRIISDIDDPTVPIVPAQGPDGNPLDLSMSGLRAVSPIHIEYLRNMGVKASLSVSIMRRGKLWGLIACHHYAPLVLAYPVRTACELFGEFFSFLLEQAEDEAARQQHARAGRLHQEIMARIAGGATLLSAFEEFSEAIRDVIPHDGIAGWVDGQFLSRGSTPDREQFLDLALFLNTCGAGAVWATDAICAIHEPACRWGDAAAGLLALPVSRAPGDYVVLFRHEHVHDVHWAGNPEKSVEFGPNGARLTPRKSFAAWKQERRGHCRPWSADEIAAADSLRVTLLEVVLQLADAARSERARAAQRQDTLIAELNHRVRNILNLIRSLVFQSKASSDTIDAFAAIVGDRIHALARAHDQVTQANWAPASLHRLIATECSAYAAPGADGRARLAIEGPDAMLNPAAFLPLALVVHELMTNSCKYGAFSRAEGEVRVATLPRPDGGLDLRWSEHGGPPVAAPQRRGFGTAIITRTIPHELSGEAEVDFDPAGLRARFVVPASCIAGFDAGFDAGAPAFAPALAPAATGGGALSGLALVVEDNMLIAMEAEDLLRELGCARCELAGSVDGALALIARHDFAFALLDVNLGHETSGTVAEALRARGVPFAVASGYGEAEAVDPRYGGAPVVTKPYAAADLAAAVARSRA